MSVCLIHYFFTMGISKQSAFHSCSRILGLPEIAAFCTFYEAVSKPIYRSKMSGNSKMQSSETWLEARKVKCWCSVTALKPADNSFWISSPWSVSSALRWGLSLTQSHTENSFMLHWLLLFQDLTARGTDVTLTPLCAVFSSFQRFLNTEKQHLLQRKNKQGSNTFLLFSARRMCLLSHVCASN